MNFTQKGKVGTRVGRGLLAGTCLGVFLALGSGQSFAQAQDQKQVSSSGKLETVTVTARYTRENLQLTPVAISAVTNDELKSANISNINTLGSMVPNLYTHPGDADEQGSPTIVMRGVVENDASFAHAPAVAIYVDGVYHSTVVGSALDLTDLDHIEVDRGPQSTLSGNASIGGAIKLFTKEPTGNNTGYLTFGYGSYNELTSTGAFDMTLAPNLFMRVSGHFKRQDGYVKSLDFTCMMNLRGTPQLAGTLQTSQPDVASHGCKIGENGGGTRAGARVKLRYTPTSRLTIDLSANYEKADLQNSPEVITKITDPYPNSNGLVHLYNQVILNQFGIKYDNRFLPPERYSNYSTMCRPLLQGVIQQPPFEPVPSGICYPGGTTMVSTTTSAQIHYDIASNIHLTSITAYSEYRDEFQQNGDLSPLGYDLAKFEQNVRQWSEEARLNGTLFDNRLNWIVGSFFMGVSGWSNGFIGYLTDNFTEYDKAINLSDSGFFHLDYHITSRWRVSGGARWTWGKVKYHFRHPGLLVIAQPFSSKEHHWDWLLSTDYQITDNTLAYATVATGSRPPGITTIVITAQQMHTTPIEEMTSYEAGLKNEFFNHRVRLNVDGFYEDYSSRSTTEVGAQCLGELPAATWEPSASVCATKYPSNPAHVPWYITVGKPATIVGFEWDLTAAPTDNLLVDFSGGYNHFESGVKTPGAPGYILSRQPSAAGMEHAC